MWLAYPTLIVVTEGGDRHEGSGAGSWRWRWVWVEPCRRWDGDPQVCSMTAERDRSKPFGKAK